MLVPPELHPVEDDTPPPSNEEFELVFGHCEISGLIPGCASSVAARGMPAIDVPDDEDESESVVPSGEVVPMPAVELACAHAAATPLIQIIAARVQTRRINASFIARHEGRRRYAPSRARGAVIVRVRRSHNRLVSRWVPTCLAGADHGSGRALTDFQSVDSRISALLQGLPACMRRQCKPAVHIPNQNFIAATGL
jgi:hypothetical protein